MLSTVHPWAFRPHPEVWLLVGGLSLLYWYAITKIGPQAALSGADLTSTRRHRRWFVSAMVVLWAATDWPLHDIGEQYLYSMHMLQHLLITMVFPPMLLLATPEWLFRLIIGQGRVEKIVLRLTRPVTATVLYNGFFVFTHWPVMVNKAVASGPLHYSLHLGLVLTALIMWMPVTGPLPERRISEPAQMGYLFLQSIVPTVPAAALIMAEGTVYKVYDKAFRLFGWSVTNNQQIAGLIMKLLGGFYLWGLIFTVFGRWQRDSSDTPKVRTVAEIMAERESQRLDGLTYEELAAEFDRLGPAPTEVG